MKKNVFGKVTQAVTIGALTVAAAVTVVPTATAAGTSGKTNGCYSTWGNTAFTGHCNPVTVSGQFNNWGVCDWQTDRGSGYHRWSKGFVGKWGTRECSFKVLRSYILYSNG
ncbi:MULTISPECIES: hypothetical protein [Streptomyces]|uniref:hypothetical protein n=1 Tax=Streptomyces TaxID=1883 RepID=UPI00226F8AA2|nr:MULTISPECIES: hypothetical protein [unclassified Streptomyces]MCY0942202.1 hypothetical protein [Streptomyces sp. H34-AA3]MCY0951892.1 hypothetical protein [Streptomyces sp. H27-S2]MCZ4088288.1 hypothetical protein [Streptomyces sp. H34-S5]